MVYFCMGFHNHQPVGNFDHVFEMAYQKSYLPLLTAFHRHPKIKVTLHYSGPLLLWLKAHHFEFFSILTEMISRGQVELMAGGFYEPILPILTHEDKLAQINKMVEFIQTHFNVKPRGIWLAERVWEPHLAKPIAQCGLDYLILDDSHFKEAGLDEAQLHGYYLTEEEGYTLGVFPSSQKLRYIMPFADPRQTIDYLRETAAQGDGALALVGDDGEKFGLWPGTYHTVYEEGWLDRMLTLLEENQDWINTCTYSEYIDRHRPLGNLYLPTASYSEMMEWVLPTPKRAAFEEALEKLERQPECQFTRPFLKGGFWRNFFVKYPEVNNMHKKMLYLSRNLQQLDFSACPQAESSKGIVPPKGFGLETDRNIKRILALDELMQAQCNCAYWHGVFGGLYLTHLRHAVYQHLIACEQLIDQIHHQVDKDWLAYRKLGLLADGSRTLMLNNSKLSLYLNLDQGGSLYEWDYKPGQINLLNNMTRRPEAYHERIKAMANKSQADDGQVKTIHHIFKAKEHDLDQYLTYDRYRRTAWLDHFLASDTTLNSFSACQYQELGDFISSPYEYKIEQHDTRLRAILQRHGSVGGKQIMLKKAIVLEANSPNVSVEYEITNLSDQPVNLWFGTELNLNPVFQDPQRTYFKGLGQQVSLTEAKQGLLQGLEMVISDLGFKLAFHLSQTAGIWLFPVYTVSQSEDGYEKNYQESCILFHWQINLQPKASWQVHLESRMLGV